MLYHAAALIKRINTDLFTVIIDDRNDTFFICEHGGLFRAQSSIFFAKIVNDF